MAKVAVVTDSCASIPDELYEQLGITMVPYNLHIGTETHKDLIDISRQTFFAYLAQTDQVPKTANPGVGDYERVYRDLLSEHEQVISLHMTSRGSGAYQAAQLAKRDLETEMSERGRIHVVDTLNVSMCHGWMTIEAARAAQADHTVADILGMIQRMIPVSKMLQTADTLRYLYLGGRIGRAKHLAASLLRIKPLISMADGEIVAVGTARSLHGAFQRMIRIMEQDMGQGARIKLAMVHVAAREKAEELCQMVTARFNCVETLFTQLTPVLSVHTGPGTVGLCYFPAKVIE